MVNVLGDAYKMQVNIIQCILHDNICIGSVTVIISVIIIIASVARAFNSTGIPVTKELTGLSRTDGKRPDGMTLTAYSILRPVNKLPI